MSQADVVETHDLAARLNAAAEVGMQPAVRAKLTPDRVAIYDNTGQDRTFGELNANANRVARRLRAAGLGAGDSVALACSNRAAFCDVLFGALRVGLRLTPVNWPDRRRDRLCGPGLRSQGLLRRRPHRPRGGNRRRPMPQPGGGGAILSFEEPPSGCLGEAGGRSPTLPGPRMVGMSTDEPAELVWYRRNRLGRRRQSANGWRK
jgi:hypothetical protein